MAVVPARRFTRIALAIVIAAVVISASALSYSSFESTVTNSTIMRVTTTNTATDTLVQTTTATTTVTSTVTSEPAGSTMYEANQVVPIDISPESGPNTTTTFAPSSVRLVIGVNNTVSFVNAGRGFVALDSIHWPTNGTGFSTPILSSGQNSTISINSPGLYTYNDYLHPVGVSGYILVVAIPGISAASDANDTISLNSLHLCSSSCQGGESFSASIQVRGDSPVITLKAYLNETAGQLTPINNNATNYMFQYSPNLAGSSWSILPGKVYFVEVVAVFADDQLAVVTASTLAS